MEAETARVRDVTVGTADIESWQPGDKIDFGIPGTRGLVLAGFPNAVAYQNSNLVVVGTAQGDMWATRVTADGRVDEAFGEKGNRLIAFPEGKPGFGPADYDTGFGLAVTRDSILVAGAAQGWSSVTEARWGVARLDRDGELDPAFGDDGLKVIDWTVMSRAFSIEQDASGAIYVAGNIENSRSRDIAVVRLFENGEIDSSFSFTGEGPGAVLDNGDDEVGLSLVVESDKILVAGASDFGVVGLTTDGPYDADFGAEGWSNATDGFVFAMDRRSDGKLLLVGTVPESADEDADNKLVIVQLNADGSLDENFASGGVVFIAPDFASYSFPEESEFWGLSDGVSLVTGLAQLPGGDLLISAHNSLVPVLLRVHSDGTLDTNFGQGGVVAFQFHTPIRFFAETSARLASDGEKAWIVESTQVGSHGVLLEVDL